MGMRVLKFKGHIFHNQVFCLSMRHWLPNYLEIKFLRLEDFQKKKILSLVMKLGWIFNSKDIYFITNFFLSMSHWFPNYLTIIFLISFRILNLSLSFFPSPLKTVLQNEITFSPFFTPCQWSLFIASSPTKGVRNEFIFTQCLF